MSILSDIYNNEYHIPDIQPKLPQDLRNRDLAFWNKISETFGIEFVDQHINCISEIENLNDIHNFREGFRFTMLLMLEIL